MSKFYPRNEYAKAIEQVKDSRDSIDDILGIERKQILDGPIDLTDSESLNEIIELEELTVSALGNLAEAKDYLTEGEKDLIKFLEKLEKVKDEILKNNQNT